MAITAAQRKKLPKNDFAGPDRSYPVDTKGRAVAAKGRATDAVKAGRMSKAEGAKIDAKANKKLGETKKRKAPMVKVERSRSTH